MATVNTLAHSEQEAAFVLHRRPYRETSLIVDFLTLNQGRVSAVAKGAGRKGSRWQAELQPFQPLRISWRGSQSLKTLTDSEATARPLVLQGNHLFCGFYLNELLQRLLTESEAAPTLFSAYLNALEALAERNASMEPALRRFEQQLAAELGFGVVWNNAMDTGKAVQSGEFYGFDPQRGVLEHERGMINGIAGEQLLAMAADDLSDADVCRTAKRLMRHLMDHLLQGRPLHSRRLFSQKGPSND